MGISFLACGYYILLDLSPDFRTKYAEFWEKRHEQKLRKQKEKDRMDAGESNGISLVGYKKVRHRL